MALGMFITVSAVLTSNYKLQQYLALRQTAMICVNDSAVPCAVKCFHTVPCTLFCVGRADTCFCYVEIPPAVKRKVKNVSSKTVNVNELANTEVSTTSASNIIYTCKGSPPPLEHGSWDIFKGGNKRVGNARCDAGYGFRGRIRMITCYNQTGTWPRSDARCQQAVWRYKNISQKYKISLDLPLKFKNVSEICITATFTQQTRQLSLRLMKSETPKSAICINLGSRLVVKDEDTETRKDLGHFSINLGKAFAFSIIWQNGILKCKTGGFKSYHKIRNVHRADGIDTLELYQPPVIQEISVHRVT